MIFTETKLKGAFVVELEKRSDDRGFFARTWCQKEFEAHGMSSKLAQCNVSYNPKKGTMRGMHYQIHPYEESKFIRCTRGAVYDVIIDLRKDSPTYKQWTGIELTQDNYKAFFVPEGFGHGYLTLTDHAEVIYLVTEFYQPGSERGIRYDDPVFNIKWPAKVELISDKDKTWPDFGE